MITGISKLALILGSGRMAVEAHDRAILQGIDSIAVYLDASLDQGRIPGIHASISQAGEILDFLKKEQVSHVLMIGHIPRPKLGSLALSWKNLSLLGRLGKNIVGDDALLSAVARIFEEEGIRVIALQDLCDGRFLEPGFYGRKDVFSTQVEKYLYHAVHIAQEIGRLDVGQAVVVQGELIIAVEGIEGTDALILRSSALFREGGERFLVKVAKPQQDRRLDMPTVGPVTLDNLHRSGFEGLLIEAGRVLIADQEKFLTQLEEYNLGLWVYEAKKD